MATKAELESQRAHYLMLAKQAQDAIEAKQYSEAIDHSVRSFQFVDSMIQFERRFLKLELHELPTMHHVLTYGPVVFRQSAIDDVEQLLKENRRIGKYSAQDWKSLIERARERLVLALRIWREVETGSQQKLGSTDTRDRDDRVFILNAWARMGILSPSKHDPSRALRFVTNLNEPYLGKCSNCGKVSKAKKIALLKETQCPHCRATVTFVLVGPADSKGT